MSGANIEIIHETTLKDDDPTEWTLWYQWCQYNYSNGTTQHGYRFMWRTPREDGGKLQPARGQARIPSSNMIIKLVANSMAAGWGNNIGEGDI